MASKRPQQTADSVVFAAKVTGRHAITLPADLCRELEIEVGDTVEFRLVRGVATLSRRGSRSPESTKGLLNGYFGNWDEAKRYVHEERSTWDERASDPRR